MTNYVTSYEVDFEKTEKQKAKEGGRRKEIRRFS